MRLLSQNIAQRANTEDGEVGKFWQARYRSVRLLDETAVLACAACVGLNPITVAMAQTIEDSDFTSAQKRVRDLEARHRNGSAAVFASPETVDGVTSEVGDLQDSAGGDGAGGPDRCGTASHLAPVELPERCDTPGPDPNREGTRCSNKGFLAMSTA